MDVMQSEHNPVMKEADNMGSAPNTFYDIDNIHNFALLIKIAMLTGGQFSHLTFREESARGVCEKYSGVSPLEVSLLNEHEALLEFSESETMLKVVRVMSTR